jgi:hypothetical protein
MPTVSITSGVGAEIAEQSTTLTGDGSWSFGKYQESQFNIVDLELLLKFDLSSIRGVVKYAKLEVSGSPGNYDTESFEVELVKIVEPWNPETVSWSTKPNYESVPIEFQNFTDTTGTTDRRFHPFYSAELTSVVNDMVNVSNNGFVFRSGYIGEAYVFINDFSDEVNVRPTLTITYNEPPNAPGNITSPSSGTRWTGSQIVRWGTATDSDTPQSELQYEGEISYDNGVSWVSLFSLTGKGVLEKQVDFTQFAESNQAKVRVRAYDGELYGNWQTSSAFMINHNLSPNAPNQLSPSGGKVIAKSEVNRFSWQHNDVNGDPQQSYDLYYRLQGPGTWTKVSGVTLNQYHDFASNAFTEGVWEWKVVTYDEEFASPDAQISIFEVRAKPSLPIITNPNEDDVIILSNPTITWTSSVQTGYELKVMQNGSTVWFINESSTNKSKEIGYSLENNSSYSFELRVKNQYGLLSDIAMVNITTDYVEPSKPIPNIFSGNAQIIIEIENVDPVNDEPNVLHNEVYKRINNEWIRVATNIPLSGQFRDYSAASGKEYEYKVRAIADNGTFSDSDIVVSSTSLKGVWLHSITDPELTLHNFRLDGGGRESSWGRESSVLRFKGRNRPVVETGEMLEEAINFNLTLLNDDDRYALESLIKSGDIICYRDGRGRLLFGVFTQFPLSDELWGGYTTQLQLLYIDYSEGI